MAGLILTALILTSCQTPQLPTAGDPNKSVSEIQVTQVGGTYVSTMEPYVFKASEPGKVTLHGFLVVLDPTSILPGPGDSIFLVPMDDSNPVSTTPSFEKGKVPQADVDERTGEFVFTNITPGKYMVMIETKGGSQLPTHWMNTSSYAVVTVDAAQVDTTVKLDSISVP